MLNKVKQFISSLTKERTDDASAIPSYVEVPLPNSSIITKDSGVA